MAQVILTVLGVIAALVGAVLVVGAVLPKRHTTTRSVRLRHSSEAVWAAITDVDGYAGWRTGLTRVERLPDADGRPRWREYTTSGKITFEVTGSAVPSRWVTRIADPDLPFGGTWTYLVTSTSDGGSTVTIAEDGEIYNPVFRFVSRFVIGHTATLDKYLTALGAKFGETVSPYAPTG